MDLSEFRQTLANHPGHRVRLVLADDHTIADHFHVTEVGRVEKQFVDCGGVRRSSVTCVLQTLVAHDTEHRLSTEKLGRILAMADELGLAGDAPVEIEHQERSVSLDAIDHVEARDGVLEFRLAAKQTACLAEDACGLGAQADGTIKLNVIGEDCCDANRGGC